MEASTPTETVSPNGRTQFLGERLGAWLKEHEDAEVQQGAAALSAELGVKPGSIQAAYYKGIRQGFVTPAREVKHPPGSSAAKQETLAVFESAYARGEAIFNAVKEYRREHDGATIRAACEALAERYQTTSGALEQAYNKFQGGGYVAPGGRRAVVGRPAASRTRHQITNDVLDIAQRLVAALSDLAKELNAEDTRSAKRAQKLDEREKDIEEFERAVASIRRRSQ